MIKNAANETTNLNYYSITISKQNTTQKTQHKKHNTTQFSRTTSSIGATMSSHRVEAIVAVSGVVGVGHRDASEVSKRRRSSSADADAIDDSADDIVDGGAVVVVDVIVAVDVVAVVVVEADVVVVDVVDVVVIDCVAIAARRCRNVTASAVASAALAR